MDKLREVVATLGATVNTTVLSLSDFGFTDAQISVARRATISTVTATVMITWDGTDPSATLGHPIPADTWAVVGYPSSVTNIKVIRQTAQASVTITLER